MKKLILLLVLTFITFSCSNDDINYVTIKGRMEREINGEGIANQQIFLNTYQSNGTGYFAYSKLIDSKFVTTDGNGNFSASMKNESNSYVSVFKPQDDDYTAFELTNFETGKELILKVNKFLKFKIHVKNINPFDSNDYININFVSGNKQSFRTKIENFGIQNIKYPAENLPGGGTIGAFEESSWRGMNVNSDVYYNVPENADIHKVVWLKTKNQVETNGVTIEIPYQQNQINEFNFDY